MFFVFIIVVECVFRNVCIFDYIVYVDVGKFVGEKEMGCCFNDLVGFFFFVVVLVGFFRSFIGDFDGFGYFCV